MSRVCQPFPPPHTVLQYRKNRGCYREVAIQYYYPYNSNINNISYIFHRVDFRLAWSKLDYGSERMGKNPHPPRAGGTSKKAAPLINGEDSSYIVFSNAKGDPKKPKPLTTDANPPDVNKSKPAASGGDPNASDVPKKPDTRALIGGASWTGKLPVNMLNEHCQKQHWEKPEYTMVQSSFF